MPAHLRLVKEIKNDLTDITQLLNEFVFGGKKISLYKETETYHQGDFVVHFNTTLGKYELVCCRVPETTGSFKPSHWNKDVVSDYISGNKINPDIIQVAFDQPTSPINLIWYQIKNVKGEIDYSKIAWDSVIFISSGDQIIAQDDEPESPDTRLWFDFTL